MYVPFIILGFKTKNYFLTPLLFSVKHTHLTARFGFAAIQIPSVSESTTHTKCIAQQTAPHGFHSFLFDPILLAYTAPCVSGARLIVANWFSHLEFRLAV